MGDIFFIILLCKIILIALGWELTVEWILNCSSAALTLDLLSSACKVYLSLWQSRLFTHSGLFRNT